MALKRSALSTAIVDLSKKWSGVGEELECLFRAEWPEFIQTKMDLMAKGAEY
jgi:hypothetical protein